MTLTYAQIEAAAKEGPEDVVALLHGAGVEIAGLPKDLRRKLRGEAPDGAAPPAKDPPPAPTVGRRSTS